MLVFRRFAIEHAALFQIAIQWSMSDPQLSRQFRDEAWQAWAGLITWIERLEHVRLLGGRDTQMVAREFHALCEGLAAIELRGMLPTGEEERIRAQLPIVIYAARTCPHLQVGGGAIGQPVDAIDVGAATEHVRLGVQQCGENGEIVIIPESLGKFVQARLQRDGGASQVVGVGGRRRRAR